MRPVKASMTHALSQRGKRGGAGGRARGRDGKLAGKFAAGLTTVSGTGVATGIDAMVSPPPMLWQLTAPNKMNKQADSAVMRMHATTLFCRKNQDEINTKT
ncbi:MAG: hypothetical protein RR808_03320 [Akkermansia sp.]